ncbi:MAG: 50S ribosomal protein L25 [Candidatus Berkelbacteria bacterium]
MSEFQLEAQKREGKAADIRRNGSIPAIVYGSDFPNADIAIDKKVFTKIFKEAGTSNLIDIKIEGKNVKTLVHDIQLHPVSGDVVHIDFFKVNMKEKITTEIPLKFIGDSPAVINLDGSLITPVDSIEVECLPADLVSEIEVDISILDDFEKDIRIADLKVPAGMEIINDPEEVIVMVQAPRSDEELESLDEEVVEDIANVEVENKGEAPVADAEDKKEEKTE